MTDKTFEKQTGALWAPVLEWKIDVLNSVEHPFDVVAHAIFTHASGEKITTGLFYLGNQTWAFRFTGTLEGTWQFVTKSDLDDLDGWQGEVLITPKQGELQRGFVVGIGNQWGWSGTQAVFVPQLVMYDSPDGFYQDLDKIDRDIQELLVEHGFSGFHVPVFCRWLDIQKEAHTEFGDVAPTPDVQTFEALELLIQKVYAAGGMVHLWMWGDNDRGHRQTPMRDDWGGKNGWVDVHLQRYIAARLGPLPGWTMGYGFDLEHWVEEEDLRLWHNTMTELMGWPHLLGGRAGSPKNGSPLSQIYDALDYAGYTHFRPGYQDYVEALEANPHRPVFSEDRFRIRNVARFKDKDYDVDRTRRGLWHSTMAGGVANIWGYMAEGAQNGQSVAYPNKHEIATYHRFFKSRFHAALKRDETACDGMCLRSEDLSAWILYKEDTDEIDLALPEVIGTLDAVAVNTQARYEEIVVDIMEKRPLRLPHVSDWAVAINLR